MSTDARMPGSDCPIADQSEDRFGFTALAQGIADSILTLDGSSSTVIGIEGPWGSGKTSLLNLLLATLNQRCPAGTHVLHISPWLTPTGAVVESLLLPVAAIIDKVETKHNPDTRWFRFRKKQREVSGPARRVLSYSQRVAGILSPAAVLGELVIPGSSVVGSALKSFSAADLSARQKTSTELRAEIEQSIRKRGLNFIIVMDDLDRLEPAQAVDVLRLVRSVADFAGFHYILSYDRDVLANAVQHRLGVTDGQQYLQKIIPQSFMIPRPEGFALRQVFLDEALAIWRSVHQAAPDPEMEAILKHFCAVYGEAFTTPREVKQVLMAVRSRYAGQKDYVFYPDLCLVQMLTVLNPALYKCVEHYLTLWPLVYSGYARVDKSERESLISALDAALKRFPPCTARLPEKLADWLPGLDVQAEKICEIFVGGNRDGVQRLHRVCSTDHWRYYFAFTAPQYALTDGDVQELLVLAGNDAAALTHYLNDSVKPYGFSSDTLFNLLMSRLSSDMVAGASFRALRHLMDFFFSHMDSVLRYYRDAGTIPEPDYFQLVTRLALHLTDKAPDQAWSTVLDLFSQATAPGWAAAYTCHLLDNATSENQLFTPEKVAQVRQAMADNLQKVPLSRLLSGNVDLLRFFLNWTIIADKHVVRRWYDQAGLTDTQFLDMLLNLRNVVVSSSRGLYRPLVMARLERELQLTGLDSRLEEIVQKHEPEFAARLNEINFAIVLGSGKYP